MMTHTRHQGHASGARSAPRRLFSLAGAGVIALAVLSHFAAGAVLVHLGIGAVVASLGAIPGSVSAGAVLLVLLAVVSIKGALFLVLQRHVRASEADAVLATAGQPGATAGKLMHGARSYDRCVAMLTLGRAGSLRTRTIDLVNLAAGERMLDAGCGTGTVALKARSRVGPTGVVAGIDPSPEMIAVAREKAQRAGLDIDFRVASVEDLPYAAATFDAVLSSLMMHHLPDELKPDALAEVHRVLVPGGRLVVVEFRRPASRIGRLAPVWLLHWSSTNQSPGELVAVLDQAGFDADAVVDIGTAYVGVTARRCAAVA